jgi:hypothetical protein
MAEALRATGRDVPTDEPRTPALARIAREDDVKTKLLDTSA